MAVRITADTPISAKAITHPARHSSHADAMLRVAITLEAVHAVEALEKAFAKYGQLGIVNTDQGSQFTGTAFTDAVLDRGIKLSKDGNGAWRDNVFVERVWRSVKYEEVYLKAYESVRHAQRSIGAITLTCATRNDLIRV